MSTWLQLQRWPFGQKHDDCMNLTDAIDGSVASQLSASDIQNINRAQLINCSRHYLRIEASAVMSAVETPRLEHPRCCHHVGPGRLLQRWPMKAANAICVAEFHDFCHCTRLHRSSQSMCTSAAPGLKFASYVRARPARAHPPLRMGCDARAWILLAVESFLFVAGLHMC